MAAGVRTCRRVTASAVMAALAVLSIAPSASAAPRSALDRRLSGSFAGTATYTGDPSCPIFRQTIEATYEPLAGPTGSLTAVVCIRLPSEGAASEFPASGTFTVATAGGTVSGTVVGVNDLSTFPQQPHYTMTITAGTGRFRGVQGTIALDGVIFGPLPLAAPTNGTLTASVTR